MGLDAEDLATLKKVGLNVLILIGTTFGLIAVSVVIG